jgi:hypothetical protein
MHGSFEMNSVISDVEFNKNVENLELMQRKIQLVDFYRA